jgi:hypothetical protein
MTPRLNRYNPVRADDIVLKDAASTTGGVLWLSSGAPGLVLAAVRGEESVVLGYGETRRGSKEELCVPKIRFCNIGDEGRRG